jgi:hypothetical protein
MDVILLINSTISKRENIDVGASHGKVNNIVICPKIVSIVPIVSQFKISLNCFVSTAKIRFQGAQI